MSIDRNTPGAMVYKCIRCGEEIWSMVYDYDPSKIYCDTCKILVATNYSFINQDRFDILVLGKILKDHNRYENYLAWFFETFL